MSAIRFGPLSIVLLLGLVQGLAVSLGLLFHRQNRTANLFLAGLVFLLSLKLVPYVIGYAGFYDAYPWLDLAPFSLTLGIGPLLFLYVRRLTSAALPKGWPVHLIPLAAQLLIYAVLFAQPLAVKDKFEDTIGPLFNRTESCLTALSFLAYFGLTWQAYRTYEAWLRNTFGDPDSNRLRYLRATLLTVSIVLCVFSLIQIATVAGLSISYMQMFPAYLVLTGAVYLLGLRAFQFAEVPYPTSIDQVSEPEAEAEGKAGAGAGTEADPSLEWRALAEGFTAELQVLNFWQDPNLSISEAAKALKVSEIRLSKAINAGLGISFSEWINRFRIAQVVLRLQDPKESRQLLEIAFECGFNSKASFNRWFREIQGCTPSEFRRR